MDAADKKSSAEVERRASRRLSRAVSVHAGSDLPDAASEQDAYLAAMGMSGAAVVGSPNTTTTTTTTTTATSATSAAIANTSTSSSASPAQSPAASLSTAPLAMPAPPEPAILPDVSQLRHARAPRPSSIAKPPVDASSSHTVSGNPSSSASSAANVRASVSSSVPPVQEEEPYEGPSGPSFPYQMYPQNVRVTRTPSGITTSTAGAAVDAADAADAASVASYTGPRRPAFPYALYPQAAVAGPSSASGPVPPAGGIPVGFPGMVDHYQRRIGPDGEEMADMIGPDGHTEQLPPYSRYPDEAYNRKIAAAAAGAPQPDPLVGPVPSALGAVPAAAAVSNARAAASPAHVPSTAAAAQSASSPTMHTAAVPTRASGVALASLSPIPGAGGLGLASRNPEFDSPEDPESPRSRESLRSFHSDGSGHEINTAARALNEKTRPQNLLQRYGRRRLLGIVPYWAICLMITGVVLLAVILGSVIGVLAVKHKKEPPHHPYNSGPVSVTVTVDASPIPTPSDLASLPTGTYMLPLQVAESPANCFNDTTQAQAWSCNIPFQYGMALTIDPLTPSPGGPLYNLTINCNESATIENDEFFYGEQAPSLSAPMALQLVNDTLEPNRGPAWFQILPYSKTVIVQETRLSVPGSSPTSAARLRRDYGPPPYHEKGVIAAQVGDKPWVCTWPDTVLEVFIYPNQNSSLYKISLSSTFVPPMAPYTTAAPSTLPTSGLAASPATATAAATTTATPGVPPTTTGTAAGSATTPQTWGPPPGMPPMPPPYPRVVKLEERRMANSPDATCVQYELVADGAGYKAQPYKDAKGNVVQITISELEAGPSLFAEKRHGVFGDDLPEKRDTAEAGLSKCGCLWMVT